jgi:hypothetical protein
MTPGTSKSKKTKGGAPDPINPLSTSKSIKKLSQYGPGLEQWATNLDKTKKEYLTEENRPWGNQIPSDKILKTIGYLAGRMFKSAARELKGIEPDDEHSLLNIYLNRKLGKPDKDIINWILTFWKYERYHPELALKAYSAIGEEKKVSQLLKRDTNDLLSEKIPSQFTKCAIVYALNYDQQEIFVNLLKTLKPEDTKLAPILEVAIEEEKAYYAIELLKKFKSKEYIPPIYKKIARGQYGYEEHPPLCKEMEKLLPDADLLSLIDSIGQTNPNTTLSLERMKKGLKKELKKRETISLLKDQNFIEI